MSDVVDLQEARRKRETKPARFMTVARSRLFAAGYKYTALGFVEHVNLATTDEGDESIAIIGPGGKLLRCIAKMRDGSYCVYDGDGQTVLETRSLDEVLKLLGVT